MAQVLFISDLHLSDAAPQITRAFLRFLRDEAIEAHTLYILGDLFEFWIGDDTLDEPLNAEVAAALSALADRGVPVRLMHGNRDFLIREQFARRARVELIDDPTIVDLFGTQTLLMHGDTMCTDDIAYQAFRRQVRDPKVQAQFLSLPRTARKQQVGQIRTQSEESKTVKSMDIMDVTEHAVHEAFRHHKYPPRMIHGHTHRPATHRYVVDGHACERWVLSDWHDHGEFLRVTSRGWERVRIDFD